jgi:outer membrane protein TolC
MSGCARSSKSSPSTSSGGSNVVTIHKLRFTRQNGNAANAEHPMSHSMKTTNSRLKAGIRMTVVALVCLVLCAGCSFAPKYAKPVVQTPAAFKEAPPEQFKEAEGWKAAEPKDDMIRGKWWEMFHEPELNAFEGQVAVSNQSVAVALANFLAARAVVKQARSQYFPTVTASPSVTRARQSSVQTQSGSSPTSFTATEYSLPFDASWELDFWGRIRNTVKANSFEAQATFADLETCGWPFRRKWQRTIFSFACWMRSGSFWMRRCSLIKDPLRLTQVQHDTGLASDQDVAQAETQLNTTRAQATDLGIQRAQLEHAIATLLGKPASSFSIATNALAANPSPFHLAFRRNCSNAGPTSPPPNAASRRPTPKSAWRARLIIRQLL